MRIIASHVRPKLISETAAGSYALVAAEQREVRPERRAAQEVRDRVLAEDDRERQECTAQDRHPDVRQDDLPEDREPAGAHALGGLSQRPDVDRAQARVDGPEHVRERQHDIAEREQHVLPMSVWVSGSGGRL